MPHVIRIHSIEPLNHNVHRFRTSKPAAYGFEPGQATEVSIMKDGWRDEKRPFTFSGLPDDDELEFTIKIYPDHNGVTQELSRLLVGDELEIGDPWGAITYKGPGTFIAGGAGITPFLSILKAQERSGRDKNTLYFANKTESDIFALSELASLPHVDAHHVLSEENKTDHFHGIVDEDFLRRHVRDFHQNFYVCGPDKMVEDVSDALRRLGANPDGITFEE